MIDGCAYCRIRDDKKRKDKGRKQRERTKVESASSGARGSEQTWELFYDG